MAMKKAEMESHRTEYAAAMTAAHAAERDGLFRRTVELVLASLEHVDGMMQYERRYEQREFDSVEGVDLVLKYAPVLLDFTSLNALESLLKDTRRIEKNTAVNLADRLADARARMWQAHHLWEHLERHANVQEDRLQAHLGGRKKDWQSLIAVWEAMGLLRRIWEGGTCRLELSTRLGEVVPAKCFACGEIAEAPKSMFLEALTCPECGQQASFVILVRPTHSHGKA
jgi:hypothetical protein